jgi:hypothetical protein
MKTVYPSSARSRNVHSPLLAPYPPTPTRKQEKEHDGERNVVNGWWVMVMVEGSWIAANG